MSQLFEGKSECYLKAYSLTDRQGSILGDAVTFQLSLKISDIGSCESILDQRTPWWWDPTDVILRYDPVEVNWEMMGGSWG